MTSYVRVQTDFENNSEEFWNAIYKLEQESNEIAKRLRDSDSFLVTEEQAEAIKALVESLDGWEDEDAAEYAPHPILFNPVTEDELDWRDREALGLSDDEDGDDAA